MELPKDQQMAFLCGFSGIRELCEDVLGSTLGARSGDRTRITFRLRDFKSLASTNFAIRARYGRMRILPCASQAPRAATGIKKPAWRRVDGVAQWRPGSESNRRTRLCRPLHDHSATRPLRANRNPKFGPYPLKKQNLGKPRFCRKLERETRLELATPTLARSCSTN